MKAEAASEQTQNSGRPKSPLLEGLQLAFDTQRDHRSPDAVSRTAAPSRTLTEEHQPRFIWFSNDNPVDLGSKIEPYGRNRESRK